MIIRAVTRTPFMANNRAAMTPPYFIPSHPDSADFVAALQRCAKDGQSVQLERLVGGGETYTISGKVVSVTPYEDRCVVQREEREPQSYWIRYLFRLINADGTTVENRAALSKHTEVAVQREKRAEDGMLTLMDLNFVPDLRLSTSTPAGPIDGTINGRACSFYAFKSHNSKHSTAVIYAKSEAAADRCMRLLDSENSVWDVFAVFLQANFLWPAWLSLREQAKAYATELRAGLERLPHEADGCARREREEFYEERGLAWQDWGPTASLDSIEGEDLDFESLFRFADKVPAPLLNLYLIVAFDSVQFFDEIDRVNATTLEQLMHYDLAIAQPAPTVEAAIDTITISQLRELVEIAGTGFKARGAASIREHLKGAMTPHLQIEAVRRARYKKYKLLPPPGWSWKQFQFLRADYRSMLDALHQWMFNGWAHPRAEERFKALT